MKLILTNNSGEQKSYDEKTLVNVKLKVHNGKLTASVVLLSNDSGYARIISDINLNIKQINFE